MADLTDALAPKNHNNPPSDVEWLGENLTLRHVHIIRAAEGHIELAENIPEHFTAENEATFATDFIKLMQNCQKELERRRKEEKEPFLRQGQFVDSFFSGFDSKLSAAILRANTPLAEWLRNKAAAEQKERDDTAKLLREQAQAAIQAATVQATPGQIASGEALSNSDAIQRVVDTTQQVRVAEAIAAAPIVSMAASRGNTGAKAALNTKWVGTIIDANQLDLTKLRPYIALAELEKAVARFVKNGGRELDGVQIKEIIETKVK